MFFHFCPCLLAPFSLSLILSLALHHPLSDPAIPSLPSSAPPLLTCSLIPFPAPQHKCFSTIRSF